MAMRLSLDHVIYKKCEILRSQVCDKSAWLSLDKNWLLTIAHLLYPRPTKLEGGVILDSPCPFVRLSVRLSVDDMVSGA